MTVLLFQDGLPLLGPGLTLGLGSLQQTRCFGLQVFVELLPLLRLLNQVLVGFVRAHQSLDRAVPLLLRLAQTLTDRGVLDVGLGQGLQDVLLSRQVLVDVHLHLLVLLQLLLKYTLQGHKSVRRLAFNALNKYRH